MIKHISVWKNRRESRVEKYVSENPGKQKAYESMLMDGTAESMHKDVS